MEPSLQSVIDVCRIALKEIDQSNIADKQLLIAVGNTGCGKSTMISSLVFGPEMLELKMKGSNGRRGGPRVIDQTEALKEKLKNEKLEGLF